MAELKASSESVKTFAAPLVALSLIAGVPKDVVGATSTTPIVAVALSASCNSLLFNMIVPKPVE